MDHELSSWVRLSENDRSPSAPRLLVLMEASSKLSLTLPYQIRFVFSRAPPSDGDDGRRCFVGWDPVDDSFANCVLLRHKNTTAEGGIEFEPVASDIGLDVAEEDLVLVCGKRADRSREFAPGDSIPAAGTLPGSVHRVVRPGETYTLLFAGAEVAAWGWADGSRVPQQVYENIGKEERPGLVVPGGAHVSFTAHEEEVPWPKRREWEAEHGFRSANYWEKAWRDKAPWRATRFRESIPTQDHIEESEQSPGAPALSVTLESAPTVSLKETLDIMIRVTYDGVCDRDAEIQSATRPFMFRTSTIWGVGHSGPHDWVYRRSRKDTDPQPWEDCNSEEMEDLGIYNDDADDAVRVAQHRDFVCLYPGESWTARLRTVRPESFHILDEVAPGDAFLCGFRGAEVDWWDWGGADDHAATVVRVLPTGAVSDPSGGGGRPKLILPGAGPVEFRTVE